MLRAECINVNGDKVQSDTQGAVSASAELLVAIDQNLKKGEVQFKVREFKNNKKSPLLTFC